MGHVVANNANRGLDVGMNPAWRDAIVHFITLRGWAEGSPKEVERAAYNDITFNKVQALRELDPDSGAYFNEVCENDTP